MAANMSWSLQVVMASPGEKRTRSWLSHFPRNILEGIVRTAQGSTQRRGRGMAHTFDIRFERSGGLGALLASPENSFRWKGAGELRIDREGISFAVKRGLLALFPLTRRVPAGQIREVYREGEALHLTFTTADLS